MEVERAGGAHFGEKMTVHGQRLGPFLPISSKWPSPALSTSILERLVTNLSKMEVERAGGAHFGEKMTVHGRRLGPFLPISPKWPSPALSTSILERMVTNLSKMEVERAGGARFGEKM